MTVLKNKTLYAVEKTMNNILRVNNNKNTKYLDDRHPGILVANTFPAAQSLAPASAVHWQVLESLAPAQPSHCSCYDNEYCW